MRFRGIRAVVAAGLLLSWHGMPAEAAPDEVRPARLRALAALDSGRPEDALAVLDSLLREDPTDLTGAYFAARAEEQAGRPELARCRFLELETVARRTEVGRAAARARQRLDEELASRFFASDGAAPLAGRGALLLPLDDLSERSSSAGFGLAWAYLIAERLAGSSVCPAPISLALLAQERLVLGRGVRLPPAVERLPVNSLPGIRARLALLPDPSGRPYLPPGEDGTDATSSIPLEDALIRFQRDRSLVPTGQGDLSTQRTLEEALGAWLLSAPPPLPPDQVAAAARLTGARYVLRGTFLREDTEVRLQMGWLDASGSDAGLRSFSGKFALDDAPALASRAVDEFLLAIGGGEVAEVPHAAPLGVDLEFLTTGLLLADRGSHRRALERWEGAEERLARWPLARARRDGLVSDGATGEPGVAGTDALLRGRWVAPRTAPDSRAVESILQELVGGASSRPLTPGAYQLLGESGRVVVHVEGP